MNAQRKDFKRFLDDILRPIRNQISNLTVKGVVTLVDDTTKMQVMQQWMMAEEIKEGIERYQNYGMTSHPHPGAEALTVFLNGNRDVGIAVVVDDRRYRIKGLEAGEVALYTDENDQGSGHRVVLRRGRVIDVKCDTLNITVDNDVNVSAKNITLSAQSELTENSAAHRINTKDYEALEV